MRTMATWCKRRWRPIAMATVVTGIVATGVALGRGSSGSVVPYPAGGQTLYGLRPTAVGLPQVGESGTVGVNALTGPLRAYHDSGAYERDLAAVDGAARNFIAQRLAAARTGRRECGISYERVPKIPGYGTLYRRVRRCLVRTEPLKGRPALVLDIDETSLSNYADLSARNFDVAALAVSAVAGHGVAIPATLQLYRDALKRGVAVFFVTGRPSAIDSITKSNLRRAGYNQGWAGVYEKPASAGTEQFKSSTRAAIARRGYEIIANVGDQQSDLDGGNADRDFKLPDPFYFISD
jgi:HAD superfamily, subfamily IIIB (Acid phosphatase)